MRVGMWDKLESSELRLLSFVDPCFIFRNPSSLFWWPFILFEGGAKSTLADVKSSFRVLPSAARILSTRALYWLTISSIFFNIDASLSSSTSFSMLRKRGDILGDSACGEVGCFALYVLGIFKWRTGLISGEEGPLLYMEVTKRLRRRLLGDVEEALDCPREAPLFTDRDR